MAITDISIPLQYIKSGTLASRPDGQFNGQIFYATDTNASYVWDGIEWQKTSVDLNNVNKLIGLNALNILDLTAQSSLTAGVNGNFERDIYTDSNGYLNSLNLSNSNAVHFINSYNNGDLVTDPTTISSGTGGSATFSSITGFIQKIKYDVRNLSSGGYINFNWYFYYKDATNSGALYKKIQTETTLTTIGLNNPSPEKEVDYLYLSYSRSGTETNLAELNNVQCITNRDDKIVQTNAQTIDAGFTKFMIVANEETTGTGSVTYDITFDGTNYQEDLESFKEYTIINAGTSLILKQKLNAGASNGIANAYNWGVLLW